MIFHKVREYLEKHGWHQGHLYGGAVGDPFPPACCQGAYNAVARAQVRNSGGFATKLARAIRDLYPDWRCCCSSHASPADPVSLARRHQMDPVSLAWHQIVCFNDDKHHTYEDIMRVLKHAEGESDGPARG